MDSATNTDSDGHKGFSFEKIISGGKTCIKDKVTGLTWSPDLGQSNSNGIAAIISSNSNLCGVTGWRLPTVKELVSIVSYHRTSPAVDNDATRGFFSDTQSASYWTSNPNAADGSKRWVVNFAYGNADNTILTDNLTQNRVRLVCP